MLAREQCMLNSDVRVSDVTCWRLGGGERCQTLKKDERTPQKRRITPVFHTEIDFDCASYVMIRKESFNKQPLACNDVILPTGVTFSPFFQSSSRCRHLFFLIYMCFPFCRYPSCDFCKSQAIVQDDPFGGADSRILESWNSLFRATHEILETHRNDCCSVECPPRN